jgi:hypothetical protein
MSQKTTGVALQTLQRVHQEAKERAAGVLFLGRTLHQVAVYLHAQRMTADIGYLQCT